MMNKFFSYILMMILMLGFLYNREGIIGKAKWKKITKADGLAAAGGFMALATYGAYLTFFGPAGAVIATSSLAMIALGSAWASGIAAMS